MAKSTRAPRKRTVARLTKKRLYQDDPPKKEGGSLKSTDRGDGVTVEKRRWYAGAETRIDTDESMGAQVLLVADAEGPPGSWRKVAWRKIGSNAWNTLAFLGADAKPSAGDKGDEGMSCLGPTSHPKTATEAVAGARVGRIGSTFRSIVDEMERGSPRRLGLSRGSGRRAFASMLFDEAFPGPYPIGGGIGDHLAANIRARRRAAIREYADNLTRHHSPSKVSIEKITKLREAARHFISCILVNCPMGSDRTGSVRMARGALQMANASIVVPYLREPS
jgi:hypothetical protein